MPIFVGTGNPDTIVGSAENDTLNGEGGNDVLFGLAGNDSLNGGTGNDSLVGGTGDDTTNGGAGDDTHYVDSNGDVVVEAVGGGADTVLASVSYTLTRGAEVEVLGYRAAPTGTGAPTGGSSTGTGPNVNLTGNEFAQVINGNAGDNVLVGGRNSNFAFGDTLNGGAGNDTLVITNFNDVLDGGADTDTAFVSIADLEAQGQAVATYTLANGSNVEVLSAQNQQGTENLRLTGSTAGSETIIGNFGANTLSGGGGLDDTLIGLDGNDTYVISSSTDTIVQETGGTDTVTFATVAGFTSYNLGTAGSTANAMANTSIEVIRLSGNVVDVTGNSVAQRIVGTAAANETLNGGGGVDTLEGGAGNDTYIVDVDGEAIIETGLQADGVTATADVVLFNGTSGGYNLADGVEIDVLARANAAGARLASTGVANGAYLVGNSTSQMIFGAAGNDILNGDRGATTNPDTLAGGAGNDIYRVYSQTDVVVEAAFTNAGVFSAADATGNDIIYTSGNYSLATNVTNANAVFAGAGTAMRIETLSAADQSSTVGLRLTGDANDNKIIGAMGNDTIDGGGGVDTMQGLGGNDTYAVDNAGDVIIEAADGGTDTVNVSIISYALNADAAVEVVNLNGTAGTTFTGNAFAQRVNGTAFADDIGDGGGADTLAGGAGNDAYRITNENVVLIDVEGTNTVNYVGTGGGFNLGNQATATVIDGSTATGNIYLVGNNGVQTIIGNAGNNILNGGGGVDINGKGDVLDGGAGDDIYRVFSSNFQGTATASTTIGDQITDSAGNDTVYTSTSYVLTGTLENLIAADQNFVTTLTLVGNASNNSVSGSAGNNVIAGGDGNDFLTGLGGADSFHFSNTGPTHFDTIQDFFAAQGDKISLDAGVFQGFGATVDGAEFQLGTVATGTQATILYDQATGRLFYDRDGAGGTFNAEIFAQLQPGTALSAADFVITPAGTIPTA